MFPRYVVSQVLQDTGAHRPYNEFTEGNDRTTLESLRTPCQQKQCGSTAPHVQFLLKGKCFEAQADARRYEGKTGEIRLPCMCSVLVTELSAGAGMAELSNVSRHSPGVDGPMA